MYSLSSIIGQTYIKYCQVMPNHRGRQKIAQLLDSSLKNIVLKTPSDLLLQIYLSSSMDLSYFAENNRNSHKGILDIIHQLDDGDIFIDIGANIGYFSVLASRLVGKTGRVLAFEPSFREFKRLLTNIQLNNLSNVLPYNIALSDYIGDCQLSINQSHTGINFLSDLKNHDSSQILVPVFTGDLILQNFQVKRNCIIKVDVEGAEYAVLNGMKSFLKKQMIKTVVVEITPKFLKRFGHTKQMLYSLMSDLGFSSTKNLSEWQYDEIFIR